MSENNPAKEDALASQQRGAGYVREQQELANTGLFAYGSRDATLDKIGYAWDWSVAGAGRGAANLAIVRGRRARITQIRLELDRPGRLRELGTCSLLDRIAAFGV
jgi:hypothetical protein